MTTTETTTTQRSDEDGRVLMQLDPSTLLAHPANPRKSLRGIKELAASIKEVGVVQALLVTNDDDGYRINAGWRRATAAVEAGLGVVPCLVKAARSDDLSELSEMVAENVNRDALTAGEEAAAYRQMSLAGMSPATIAKVSGRKRTEVVQAIEVGANEVAVAVASRYDLTMDQAAGIAEFSDDKEVVKELTRLAVQSPGNFEHRLSRLRQDREEQAAVAALLAECDERGVRVIDRPDYDDRSVVAVRKLYDHKGRQLDEAKHVDCLGHAVAVTSDWSGVRLVAYCARWKENGHRTQARAEASDPGAEAIRQAERREVIENNKAWRAAEPVRRQFVAQLCGRRSAPKGVLRFVVTDSLAHSGQYGKNKDELLGIFVGEDLSTTTSWQVPSLLRTLASDAADGRLPLLLLGHVAASVESLMGAHTWRNSASKGREARYLAFLASQGYALSEIEAVVVGAVTDDDDLDDDLDDEQPDEEDDEQEDEEGGEHDTAPEDEVGPFDDGGSDAVS
jgi:ParB family transcriptional regulator, chromosome partitioning protein